MMLLNEVTGITKVITVRLVKNIIVLSTNFIAIAPKVVEIFNSNPKNVCLTGKSAGFTKVIKLHCLGTMSVSTKFIGNPSNGS